ncbi:MAG: hypothetical protein S0880_22340 [Actinomycetota bacterium]|nr:hypothetical protein [Actinomycetota bacterium]
MTDVGWGGTRIEADDAGYEPADRPVVLSDFVSRREAHVVAARLVAEDIPAVVVDDPYRALPEGRMPIGPMVMVRSADRREAADLVRLLDEVDRGISRVAPPLHASIWTLPYPWPLVGLLVLVLILGPVGFLVLAAL